MLHVGQRVKLPILLIKSYRLDMVSVNVVFVFGLIFVTSFSESAKILAVFPMAASSHYILGNALLRGLAYAGHDVTMISPFVEKNPPKNGTWRDIPLTGFSKVHEEMTKKMDPFSNTNRATILSLLMLPKLGVILTEKTLNHTNVNKLLNSGEKFDVVIAGQFMNDAVKALATHFNAHLIIFSSVGSNSMINHLVGNPSLPSFAPEILANFPPKMTFWHRLENTITKFMFSSMLHLFHYPHQNALVKKYLSESLDLDDVLYNVSLILLNSHVSFSNPKPYVPCMIDIGGFHINPPKKLPADLQSFLDNATEGVVYMSMGSNLNSKDLPIEKIDAILKTFSKLKKKILWKWEDDVLPNQPPNVKLGKWFPQQGVLAHPNVEVFITHGGLLSTTEAVYFGVPIISIPIFGDQNVNAYIAENDGYGLVLPFHELTEEKLSSLLGEMFSNPRYKKEAELRSRIINDRQDKPLDTAVYWVEYVIRHNGAKHLKVAYLDLAWYQYYLLDVFAFILIVTVLGIILIRKAVIYIVNRTKKPKQKII